MNNCYILSEIPRATIGVLKLLYTRQASFFKTIFVLWKISYVDSISFQKLQRELRELKEKVTKKDDEKRKREKEIVENDKLHEEK